jgi:hypothetical protein
MKYERINARELIYNAIPKDFTNYRLQELFGKDTPSLRHQLKHGHYEDAKNTTIWLIELVSAEISSLRKIDKYTAKHDVN